jgi:hypothetical protein
MDRYFGIILTTIEIWNTIRSDGLTPFWLPFPPLALILDLASTQHRHSTAWYQVTKIGNTFSTDLTIEAYLQDIKRHGAQVLPSRLPSNELLDILIVQQNYNK